MCLAVAIEGAQHLETIVLPPDRKRMRYVRAKNIKKIREQRLAAAKPVPVIEAVNDNKKDMLTPVVPEVKVAPQQKPAAPGQ